MRKRERKEEQRNMDIRETIKHAKQVADEKYKEGFICYANSRSIEDDRKNDECIECAKDHQQLAEWLEELQQYQEIETEIRERYHANVDIKELMRCFIETIFKGERHDEFCFLTNEDAKMWKEYQAIGTVKECQEAIGKQLPKKPI